MATYTPTGTKFTFIFSGLMIAAVALFYAWRMADTAFLSENEGVGKVVGKEHVPYHEESRMQNVGGINQMVKIAIPDTWLLTLDLGSGSTQASVPYDEYERLKQGDAVRVRFRRHRLKGNLEVTRYLGKAGG